MFYLKLLGAISTVGFYDQFSFRMSICPVKIAQRSFHSLTVSDWGPIITSFDDSRAEEGDKDGEKSFINN